MNQITNRRIISGSGPDFYPTPGWATEALLYNEKFSTNILEPACGDGAISEVLIAHGYNVTSSDLNNHGYGQTGIDYLTSNTKVDNTITNPPYNLAEQFLHVALGNTNYKVALLLRLAFLESVTRFKNVYSVNPPSTVWVFSQRLSMYPKGSTVKGGGTTSYGWFIFDKQDTSGITQLKWIKPGYKK